jgi:hypothetical protein
MAAVQKLCARAVWLDQGRVRMNGDAEQVVSAYVDHAAEMDTEAGASVSGELFRDGPALKEGELAKVHSIDLVDAEGRPLSRASTWDRVALRFGFAVSRTFRSFSVEFKISTAEGVPLILSSTTPDQNLPLSVEPGSHVVECLIDQLPLAAGEYVIAARLAIPGIEYVWRNEGIARLQGHPRDVFGSALPPVATRCLVVTAHHWRHASQFMRTGTDDV